MIICADDFGLRPDINHAILDLATQGKLSAVSCMVNAPALTASDIGALQNQPVEIGLHFAITEVPPLTSALPTRPADDFLKLAAACYAGRNAPKQTYLEELSAQYKRFLYLFGKPPDFIDSHQHAHQLPGIRRAVIAFVQQLDVQVYVRNSYASPQRIFYQGVSPLKTLFIAFTGWQFRNQLRAAKIPTNAVFTGIYHYSKTEQFPYFLDRFLICNPEPNALMMIHPGQAEAWRLTEYQTLLRTLIVPRKFRYGTP